MTDVELVTTRDFDGGFHFWLEPAPQEGLTNAVWISNDDGTDKFYIEPCGQFPGGFFVPIRYLEGLLAQGLVRPHFYDYDRERWEAINEEGLAFDICAESETPEADAIEAKLVALGGFIG